MLYCFFFYLFPVSPTYNSIISEEGGLRAGALLCRTKSVVCRLKATSKNCFATDLRNTDFVDVAHARKSNVSALAFSSDSNIGEVNAHKSSFIS